TSEDYQTAMNIPIYQGESPMAKNNEHVAQFDIIGLPSKYEGEVEVNVTMHIDENGILKVSAKEKSIGVYNSIEVTSDSRNLGDKLIKALISKNEKMKKKDEEMKETVESRNELERFVSKIRRSVNDEDCDKEHTKKTRKFVNEMVEKIQQWLKDNPKATKAEIEKEHDKLLQFKRQLKI
ncbi:hypothetical protein B4U80_08748, partial [Leptotrombidium deliense]